MLIEILLTILPILTIILIFVIWFSYYSLNVKILPIVAILWSITLLIAVNLQVINIVSPPTHFEHIQSYELTPVDGDVYGIVISDINDTEQILISVENEFKTVDFDEVKLFTQYNNDPAALVYGELTYGDPFLDFLFCSKKETRLFIPNAAMVF